MSELVVPKHIAAEQQAEAETKKIISGSRHITNLPSQESGADTGRARHNQPAASAQA